MKCDRARPELVVYHFGETALDLRDDLEAHLLCCKDCLGDYLRLKREIETADPAEKPSREARARLRAAVAAEVAPEERRRPWSWWERPTAFLFAGATVLAAIFVVQMVASGPGTVPHSLDRAPETVEVQGP